MIIVKELLRLLLNTVIAFVIGIFIIVFIGQITYVRGYSMEPSLQTRDVLVVEKVTYRFTQPSRFDVIAFPFSDQEYHIKRIIGLPGETVQIIDGNIYINGVFLNEDFGYEETIQNPGIAGQPILLGEDEYFLLGDNRNRSRDSRDVNVGVRHKDEFVGRAWIRIWPLTGLGLLE